MAAASGKLPGFVIILATVPLFLAGAVQSGSDESLPFDGHTPIIQKTFAAEHPGLMNTRFVANLPPGLQQNEDRVGDKLLREFGAVFVARGGVTAPDAVVFRDAESVAAFQARVGSEKAVVGGINVELQSAALKALLAAENDAHQRGLNITPRGTLAAKRSYEQTVSLWTKRVDPALDHWRAVGRIPEADARRIKGLSYYDQVSEVMGLEDRGIYLSKDLARSIIYSGAPPGSSQHLSMLALDIVEFDNPAVRDVLAKHGWFQTVVSDLPHFTYLGANENDLPELGLKKVVSGGRSFWVPDIR
jgi:hypothetical protein